MQFLRKIVERGRKLYHEPSSKFHKLWPLFDAHETFLFSPEDRTPRSGPHVRDYNDLKRTMMAVIFAMTPCLLWAFYNTGYQHFAALASMPGDGAAYTAGWMQGIVFGGSYVPDVSAPGLVDNVVFGLQCMLPILIVSYGVGLTIEMGFAIWRQEEVSEGYLVSGMLIALIVPPSIPLWQLAVAVAFSVVLCKEIFGGTGMNVFNVAMMARAFLFFSYAGQMSGDAVWVAGNDTGAAGTAIIDGYSAPTALSAAASAQLESNHLDVSAGGFYDSAVDAVSQQVGSWSDLFFGLVPGSAGETSTFCVLLGALFLVVTGVGSWRTMLAGLFGLFAMSTVFTTFAGDLDGIGGFPWHWHLVSGGFAFGIVFMATDPVTSPETNLGKWIYGFLIGAITVLVRAVNPAYPEGMMLAVLLLNAFAPAIDHFIIQASVRRRRVRLGG